MYKSSCNAIVSNRRIKYSNASTYKKFPQVLKHLNSLIYMGGIIFQPLEFYNTQSDMSHPSVILIITFEFKVRVINFSRREKKFSQDYVFNNYGNVTFELTLRINCFQFKFANIFALKLK